MANYREKSKMSSSPIDSNMKFMLLVIHFSYKSNI